MKNNKYLLLLLFLVMILVGCVSAADNDSAIDDSIVKHSSSTDVKTDTSSDTVEYSVKSTTELNSVVNDANTTANTVVVNVDKDQFVDDDWLMINLGENNMSHQTWSYYPTDKARNQNYKNVIINANNATFDLSSNLWYEDIIHMGMDGDKYTLCGIIEVGEGYTLTFNNANLLAYDIMNYGTIIFNNSALIDGYSDNFVCDNHGTIIIENSSLQNTGKNAFINNETANLTIRNSSILSSNNCINGGNVILEDNYLLNTGFYYDDELDTNLTYENNITNPDKDKKDSIITFGDIEDLAGEVEVKVYVNDEDGNKVHGGYVKIFFDDGICTEYHDSLIYEEYYPGIYNYWDDMSAVSEYDYDGDGNYFMVRDGVATAIVLFYNESNHSMIKANYTGSFNVNPSYNQQEVSLSFQTRNASLKIINEEHTSEEVILTLKVEDLSEKSSKYNRNIAHGKLSYDLNSTQKNKIYNHFEEALNVYEIYIPNSDIPQNQEECTININYSYPYVYNNASTTYSFKVNSSKNTTDIPTKNESEVNNNDSTTEKINSMITFGDIEGNAGEPVPVNIYVTDFDGNKINEGYVNIYFMTDNVKEVVKFYKTDESGKKICMIDSSEAYEPMNFEVIDGVATAYIVFTKYDYTDILAKYLGTDNVNPTDFYGQALSLDFPLRNASIKVIKEEQTADNVILTVEVKDLSGSDLLDYLDEDGLSFSINNGPDYEIPEISHTHYYEENGTFYLVFAKEELDKTMDNYYTGITYINPAYNEVTTTYSFKVNKTSPQNTTPKDNNSQNHSNSIKPAKQLSKVAFKTTPKKVNKVLPKTYTNSKTINMQNGFTLGRLNELFDMDFSNQTLLIYIGDTLVYNGTTTDDLLEVLFNLTDAFKGNYTITVKTGNDTYNETITI